MKYLLDTDTCLFVINKRPPRVFDRLERVQLGDVGVSVVTVAELAYGVAKVSARRREEALELFLAPLEIVDWTEPMARRAAAIRAGLEARGTPIGPYDLQIAAAAVSLDVTLITNNTREFSRVPELRLENWVS